MKVLDEFIVCMASAWWRVCGGQPQQTEWETSSAVALQGAELGRDTNNYTKEELCTLEYLNMIKNFDVYWCARESDQFNSGSPNS